MGKGLAEEGGGKRWKNGHTITSAFPQTERSVVGHGGGEGPGKLECQSEKQRTGTEKKENGKKPQQTTCMDTHRRAPQTPWWGKAQEGGGVGSKGGNRKGSSWSDSQNARFPGLCDGETGKKKKRKGSMRKGCSGMRAKSLLGARPIFRTDRNKGGSNELT